jgi:hypothetical protein
MRPLLIAFGILFFAAPAWAQDFVVNIGGHSYREDATIRPCYPLTAIFFHPNINVTKVRMENPRDPSMYMMFPVDQRVAITLHENFMRSGEWSFSDFVAIDDAGKEYGRFQLIFEPRSETDQQNDCGLNS